jgi:hypothetical protein
MNVYLNRLQEGDQIAQKNENIFVSIHMYVYILADPYPPLHD